MLNLTQFSAAKNLAETKMLQSLVFKEDGVRKDFGAFKKDAKEVTDIFQETWLRTEYDTSLQQAVAGEQFRSYREDSDLYPYWQYLETTSDHPREEHLELVGNIYKIGDPESDEIFPPNGFNCGCSSEQLSAGDVGERPVSNGAEDIQHVDPQFRFNPADQGILPKESHSYFEVLKNANDADGETFGYDDEDKGASKLVAKGLHGMVNLIHDWRDEYHTDKLNNIIFQNKTTLTNVKFTNHSMQTIQKHSAGFEQLPGCVTAATEIWQQWGDAKQHVVLRTYMKGHYIVKTRDGVIVDAYLVDSLARYRAGVVV